jgi:hypothetical protein
MLAPHGEGEGAEPVSDGEGNRSGEEPGEAAVKNPPALGERDVVTVGDGTGEVSLGRRPKSVVTTGISW